MSRLASSPRPRPLSSGRSTESPLPCAPLDTHQPTSSDTAFRSASSSSFSSTSSMSEASVAAWDSAARGMRRALDETRVMRRRDDTWRGATRAAWAMVS